jgi:hypothetical protein
MYPAVPTFGTMLRHYLALQAAQRGVPIDASNGFLNQPTGRPVPTDVSHGFLNQPPVDVPLGQPQRQPMRQPGVGFSSLATLFGQPY